VCELTNCRRQVVWLPGPYSQQVAETSEVEEDAEIVETSKIAKKTEAAEKAEVL